MNMITELPQSGNEFLGFKLCVFSFTFLYSILIALTGQASTQTPQSMQASAFTTALPSTMLIASLGHSDTQDSQPVHIPSLTLAGIYMTLSKKQFRIYQ
jgi:hypothetical protein